MDMLYRNESYAIRSCVFAVNRKLGSGFLESVYQEAMEIELGDAGIPFESQKHLQITYNGKPMKQTYIADIVCYGKIMVELKAVKRLSMEHEAQLLNYLTATGMKLGLLVNFGTHPKAEIKRLVRTETD
jgi:GxxExxY protein